VRGRESGRGQEGKGSGWVEYGTVQVDETFKKH